jgi:hypothetical protein
MVSRRDLISSGAAFSFVRPAESAAAQRGRGDTDEAILTELREIRNVLQGRSAPSWQTVDQIRERQRTFLRVNQRFPDRIDVGVRIWERMYDWHILNQRELKIGRAADGRLEMEFMFTGLVLRTDFPDLEIGVPYDR